MPKVVDKEERRAEFIAATWRVIVREGFEGVTLRRVAAEVGYSNGAIRHFFSSKAELLTAAFELAIDHTVDRATAAAEGKRGIAALRAWCEEIMPIDEDKVAEARVVLAFWEDAIASGSTERRFSARTSWDDTLLGYVRQARADGDIRAAESDEDILNILTWMMGGLQSRVLLAPEATSREHQLAALDAYLRLIG
jgi:AcrR family transcriptional regulator